jgi:hypothetical protein
MRLSNLYVWRNVCSMYLPLESFLSTQEIADECLVCIDPDFPEDVKLANALAAKFPKVRVIHFRWPPNAPGDGSRIGIASQFALQNATGDYCLNVQADELYPTPLMEWIRDNWKTMAQKGLECLRFKVLNLEWNMSRYQGGNDGSSWSWQKGAGYNCAIKLFRHCPKIRFAHDGWSMENCAMLAHAEISETYPIVHCHDNFRDTLIQLRKTASEEIWTDREKYGHYAATANSLENTRDSWWNDPCWIQTDSPFSYLLPEYAKRLIGKTKYEIDWGLLNG